MQYHMAAKSINSWNGLSWSETSSITCLSKEENIYLKDLLENKNVLIHLKCLE
jgi:hypothetical protein